MKTAYVYAEHTASAGCICLRAEKHGSDDVVALTADRAREMKKHARAGSWEAKAAQAALKYLDEE